MALGPRPRRILVSGGAGFIGSELVRLLRDSRAARFECAVVDDLSAGTGPRLERLRAGAGGFVFHAADVSRVEGWRRVFRSGAPFHAVVHLAGRVGVRRVLEDPEACRAANLAGVSALLDALTDLPAEQRPQVFAASTSEVYGERDGELGEDSSLRSEAPSESPPGRWAYAASKRRGEELLDSARALFPPGRAPVHLRFFNVVGPGQDARTGMVVPTFVERVLAGATLPVYGDGKQRRTFGHVSDVARALVHMLARESFPPGPINLGGFARTSVLELARTVVQRQAALHPEAPVSALEFVDPLRVLGPGFDEVRFREPSLERARRLAVPLARRSLLELVDDCLLRHSGLALAPLGSPAPASSVPIRNAPLSAVPAAPVDAGQPPFRQGLPCASLGS